MLAVDEPYEVARLAGYHCPNLNLVPSHTVYVKWAKGPRTPMRLTKTGEKRLEEIYARHFVLPGKGPFPPPREKSSSPDQRS